MSLTTQIISLATRIGQEVKLLMRKSANLSDVANRQAALNNLTDVVSAANEHVLTKDTTTGNLIFKQPSGSNTTYGIANGNAVKVSVVGVASGEYAKFNGTGLESWTPAEVLSDIGGASAGHNHNGVYEAVIIKGNTAQYFRGDMSLAAMPTSLPASDVYAWAKAVSKPTYSAAEVGSDAAGTARPASDVSAWAKAATKPSYTATEVGSDAAGTARPANGGNADTVAGLSVHTDRNREGNKIVRTDGSGYLQVGYINSSNGNENNDANADRVWGTNGSDDYLRTYRTSALAVATALKLSNTLSNWSTVGAITGVTGLLAWKNYGNGHVIFDASSGISPSGGAVNNATPEVPWSGSYPCLMGWNGSSSYGLRVDVCRYADSAGNASANDVYAWAKASSKPSYSAAEVGSDAAGTARPASDVYAWAKAASKPSYSAAEVGASASGHSHDYATHRGEGTNFIEYAYAMYDAYAGGWRTSNDLRVLYAQTAGSAPASDVYAWAKQPNPPTSGSFTPSVIGGNTTAVKNTLYVLTASLTLTLPSSPSAGDSIKVSNLSGVLTCSIARNGSTIMGLSEDLTLDKANAGFEMMFTNATYGWVII